MKTIIPITIIGLLLIAVFSMYISAERELGPAGFPLDDAWIHAQFARNMATGNGFSFNPGEPMAGSTGPLWSLMLVPVYWFTTNIVFAAKFLGITLHIAIMVLTYFLALNITGSKLNGCLSAAAVGFGCPFIQAALSGMETSLYVALGLAGLLAHVRFRREKGWKAFIPTVLFTLAALARPELLILVPLSLVDILLLSLFGKDQQFKFTEYIKFVLISLGIYILILLPYVIFNMKTVGLPVPNTFAAKVSTNVIRGLKMWINGEGSVVFFRCLLKHPLNNFLQCLELLVLESSFLAVCLFGGIIMEVKSALSGKRKNSSLMLTLTFIAYPLAMGMFAPRLGNSIVYSNGRYVALFLAIGFMFGMIGLVRGIQWLADYLIEINPQRFKNRTMIVTVLAILLILPVAGAQWFRHTLKAPLYAGMVDNINDMQVRIGKWLEESSPPDAVIATNDIGAIGYFGNRYVIDTIGLVTPQIIPYIKEYGPEEGVNKYIREKNPQYVALFPKWYPNLTRSRDLQKVWQVRLENNIICGDDTMIIFKPAW